MTWAAGGVSARTVRGGFLERACRLVERGLSGLRARLSSLHRRPRLSREERYLAASSDQADCERRLDALARRHETDWRLFCAALG
jgi:hypothetical protein